MAKFAVFFTFTGQTVKALMDHPSDRAAVVSNLCEAAGGRMESYYLMFGPWDGFVIAEVPDSKFGGSDQPRGQLVRRIRPDRDARTSRRRRAG